MGERQWCLWVSSLQSLLPQIYSDSISLFFPFYIFMVILYHYFFAFYIFNSLRRTSWTSLKGWTTSCKNKEATQSAQITGKLCLYLITQLFSGRVTGAETATAPPIFEPTNENIALSSKSQAQKHQVKKTTFLLQGPQIGQSLMTLMTFLQSLDQVNLLGLGHLQTVAWTNQNTDMVPPPWDWGWIYQVDQLFRTC